MGFRTVVIKNRSKLDLCMNYLVCRGVEEAKIYIPEISYLILESTAISLTSALLSELIKNNVKIIFCDEKHNPESELVGLYSNYDTVSKIKNQINWTAEIKANVWQAIIKNKITQQLCFLEELNFHKEAKMLKEYAKNVQSNDLTNREGHSAKVYFNALFGLDFFRRNDDFANGVLNYGYSILLSCFNREIVRQGYLTQLGIWHKNEFNYFNLSCDLMEPFRILIDRLAYKIVSTESENSPDFRIQLMDIFNKQVYINNKKQFFENAITIYCQNIFETLNKNDIGKIKFYEL